MRTWLESARQVRLIHIHERSFALATDLEEVVSVVSPVIGDGPIHLVVPPSLFHMRPAIDCQISIENSILSIHEKHIDLSDVHIWDPMPDWPLIRKEIRLSIEGRDILTGALQRGAAKSRMARWTIEGHSSDREPSDQMRELFLEGVEDLRSGIRETRRDRYVRGASKLIGLGDGLTPEGDDYLLGAVLGMWCIKDEEAMREISAWIGEAIANKTTLLSAALLRSALEGKCNAPWHALFNALIKGDESELIRPLEQILDYGHCSGAAALGGWIESINLIDDMSR